MFGSQQVNPDDTDRDPHAEGTGRKAERGNWQGRYWGVYTNKLLIKVEIWRGRNDHHLAKKRMRLGTAQWENREGTRKRQATKGIDQRGGWRSGRRRSNLLSGNRLEGRIRFGGGGETNREGKNFRKQKRGCPPSKPDEGRR